MSRFRGPDGRLHFPKYRDACWRNDVTGCCAVCYVRTLRTVVMMYRRGDG